MKQRFVTLLLALIMALTLAMPVWAETRSGDVLIYDTADLLTEDEWQTLDALADQVTWRYDCAVYVVTVDDYEQYGSDAYSAAANIYNDQDFGIGGERNGVLLLLSMWDRSYSIYVRDGYAKSMVSDYAQGLLEDSFLPYFGSDDWYGGFNAYLTTCADFFQQAEDGHPVKRPLTQVLPMTLGIGVAVALVVCLILKGMMKTVRQGAEADAYVTAEGLTLTERYDRYTHTTETRQPKKDKDSGSHSGGGGSGRSGHF